MVPFIKRPLSKRLRQAVQDFCDEIIDALESQKKSPFTISFNRDFVFDAPYGEEGLYKAFDYLVNNGILGNKSYEAEQEYGDSEEVDGVTIATFTMGADPYDFVVYVDEDKFDRFYKELNNEVISKSSKKSEEIARKSTKTSQNDESIVFEIDYSGRKCTLLKKGQVVKHLSKNNFEGENDRVMTFLMQNANRTIQIDELTEKAGDLSSNGKKILSKNLHLIINALGIKGDFQKMFFDKNNKGALRFHNPVTKSRLEEVGLGHLQA